MVPVWLLVTRGADGAPRWRPEANETRGSLRSSQVKPGVHSVARPGSAAGLSGRGHRFSVVSMISCRPGQAAAELACPALPGPVCPRPGVRSGSVPRKASRLPPAPRSGRVWLAGAQGSIAPKPLPEAQTLPANGAQVTGGHDVCRWGSPKAITRSPWPRWPADGQAGRWQSWRGPVYGGCGPHAPRAGGGRLGVVGHVHR